MQLPITDPRSLFGVCVGNDYVTLSWQFLPVRNSFGRLSQGLSYVIFQFDSDIRSRNVLVGTHRVTYPLTNPEIRGYVEHLAKLRGKLWEVAQLIGGRRP